MDNTYLANLANQKNLNFSPMGWKYYNSFKKKAMESEFSWSGLIASLSIAFFVVLASAFLLSFIHYSIRLTHMNDRVMENNIYRFEGGSEFSQDNYLQSNMLELGRLKSLPPVNFA